MRVGYLLCSFLLLRVDALLPQLSRRNMMGSVITMSSMVPGNNNNKVFKNLIINSSAEESSVSEVGIIQDVNNDIYFYAPVTQRSCFELKNKLMDLDAKSKIFQVQYKIDPPPIHLHIQSEGGSLYHTLYIIDLIRKMETPVYTYVDGFAASAASLISVVGAKRYMTDNSLILIHQLSGSESGKYNEMQDQMSNMSILMSIIRKIYLEYTKLDEGTLNALLQKDLWLESKTCLAYGLVDEII
jgi:ATP-dependent protease ClpP protease subunit